MHVARWGVTRVDVKPPTKAHICLACFARTPVPLASSMRWPAFFFLPFVGRIHTGMVPEFHIAGVFTSLPSLGVSSSFNNLVVLCVELV